MPTFDFTCEVCGKKGRQWRDDKPPRFCSVKCRRIGMAGERTKAAKWVVTPEIHEAIRKLYQTEVGMTRKPAVKQLAEKVGLPRWKISRHAIRQGWIPTTKKEPEWSEKELKILRHFSHLGLEGIQKCLRKAGFKRSVTGISVKKKRLRLGHKHNGYSARQVAECFGIDEHSVIAWIRRGRLRATRRGTVRKDSQGGDIYFIEPADIKEFIFNNIEEIDLRKVDKFWFVAILGNGNGSKPKSGPDDSPCLSCENKYADKRICSLDCDKLDAYQRSRPRSMCPDDGNDYYSDYYSSDGLFD